MWPIASIVGAPCWPLKNIISEAHDTWLPGAWPKISYVILWVRLSANEYGGFRLRSGDWSFQVKDRSNIRTPFTVRISSSAEGRLCAVAVPARAAATPRVAAEPSHCRRET